MTSWLSACRGPIAIGIGFAFDTLLGVPKGLPHLVKLNGKQIEFEEKLARKCHLPQTEKADDYVWPLGQAQTVQLAYTATTADVVLLAPRHCGRAGARRCFSRKGEVLAALFYAEGDRTEIGWPSSPTT